MQGFASTHHIHNKKYSKTTNSQNTALHVSTGCKGNINIQNLLDETMNTPKKFLYHARQPLGLQWSFRSTKHITPRKTAFNNYKHQIQKVPLLDALKGSLVDEDLDL